MKIELKGNINSKIGYYPSLFSREYQIARANYDARIRNWIVEYSYPYFLITAADKTIDFVFYDGTVANCTCNDFIKIESSSCMHIEALKSIPYWDIKKAVLDSRAFTSYQYIDFKFREVINKGKDPLVLPSVRLYEDYKKKTSIDEYNIDSIKEWDVFADFGISLYDYQVESVMRMLMNRRTILH